MLNVKGKDKGCVRREAGSEKREWQEARGDQAAHQTTTQLTHQRCAANTDMKTDTNTNTDKRHIQMQRGKVRQHPINNTVERCAVARPGWLVGGSAD